MRKDPWFLVASTLAVGVALALALQGRFVFAGIALIVLPSGGGNLRRLIVGIDERDRTYRIRARLEQGN
jgi:hypothetical protein